MPSFALAVALTPSMEGSLCHVTLLLPHQRPKPSQDREEVLLGSLQKDRGQVEQARSRMQTQASRKGVLGALMEQKRCGAIPGIYGRLGDLGAIDDKLDLYRKMSNYLINFLIFTEKQVFQFSF